jgi:hyperosmotically inducible periplasmic protein
MSPFEGRRLRRLALAGAAGALLVGVNPVSAADDAAILRKIEARFAKADLDREGEIHVAVEEGRARLTGFVTTVYRHRLAERMAAREAEAVDNRLRVVPEERPDVEIRDAVRETLLQYPYDSVFDSVAFGVDRGVVVLRGSVNQPYRRSDIWERVARVAGVRAVVDQIEVQSVSIFDARLRLQIARAIYGDPRFVQYADRAHPPIRVVVDKGRVTLTGYVASPVEQALLGHIARGFLAFEVDNQVRVDGESPEETAGGSSAS